MSCGAAGALPRWCTCLAHLGSAERRIDPCGDKSGVPQLQEVRRMAQQYKSTWLLLGVAFAANLCADCWKIVRTGHSPLQDVQLGMPLW